MRSCNSLRCKTEFLECNSPKEKANVSLVGQRRDTERGQHSNGTGYRAYWSSNLVIE
jgi:hypothetical protein